MTDLDRELLITVYHFAGVILAVGVVNVVLGVCKLAMMLRVVHATAEDRETIRAYANLIRQYAILNAREGEDDQRQMERATNILKDTASKIKCRLDMGEDETEGGNEPASLPSPNKTRMSDEEYVRALKRLIRNKEREIADAASDTAESGGTCSADS